MAAPEFTLFVKPYLEGWANGEEGNTPITAEILNDNYDAFLLALNDWAASVGLILESAVTDSDYTHTDNNYTTTEKDKLSGIEDNANNYSLPTASTSTLGGVKIDGVTITIANGVISAVGGGGTDVEGNPSGTPTAVLSSIKIGNDIFSIPGGGSGGSSVSFTQILSSGTKIGTITIDGVPTDIYAPTAPTKTSDLTNDSNFVSDSNYTHTDNNYTNAEKSKLSGLSAVEANPSGSASTDLTKIAIGGTNYNIPSGGGGTTVVANPTGSATAGNLNKLQVGDDVYQIPSGGSGSGGHTILNDSGTALSQEDNLQFKGVYSHDDSTNEKTIVEVTRSMTLAQYQSLSDDEKKGVIAVTDDSPEPSYTDIVGTLTAGLTSITLSDSSITTSSTIEVFDELDIPYNDKTLSNGSITLTFDAQQNDMIVKVRVS